MLRQRLATVFAFAALIFVCCGASAGDPNGFAWLDDCHPWYPHQDTPKLTTPQWVGDEGVECVVVLAIDDLRDTAKYEAYLRPILTRLKQIDGRAPVSIMTNSVKPDDPQLQSWLDEGLSIECHTADHPCPLLQGGDFAKAKSTYDRCIDLLAEIPNSKPVAFRTPCCDSLNTVSPRFYSEIFNRATPEGNSLQIDSSVFNFFTSDDESIPRDLILDEDGNERFWKYLPRNNSYKGLTHDNFANCIKNYPYPYVINNSCWQFPCVAPSDWSAQHLHGVDNPITVADWKAALDITVHKQGVFNLVFHPHGWISAQNVVSLIDHAVEKHGAKVKFLTFREAAKRLNDALTSGKPIHEASAAEYAKLRPMEPDSPVKMLQSVPPELRSQLIAGELDQLPPLERADGSHNGFFVRDRHLCWQNEDTSHLPDFTMRVSFADAVAMHRPMKPVAIGAAIVDITPDDPVRLSGYGNRRLEATEVAARIHARALVIGAQQSPVPTSPQNAEAVVPLSVLLTVDNCGVPANVTAAVFDQLASKHGLLRERFAISSTHTHSAPWLRGFAPNGLVDVPAPHADHLANYEQHLIGQLVEVVGAAIESQRPGHLSRGTTTADFAVNRRALKAGQWQGFGEAPDAPIDRALPVLAAHDLDGQLIAVLANYACHATTETGEFNEISGDWPGLAADMLEADHPGAVALVAIGCGADANPSPRGTHELAMKHGRSFADAVNMVLKAADGDSLKIKRISSNLKCQLSKIDLPLGPLPTREHWEAAAKLSAHAGVHGKKYLQMLDDGIEIPTTVPNYPVQTWCFGDDLAMVFLGGEVVVDYSLRLNTMLDSDRLWINAYSNDVPCYIPSKRILREGGYEADQSMIYYDRPTRLSPEVEDLICDTVQKLLPHEFYSEDLQAKFPRPKSPDESLAAIRVRPGLTVELVAAEPLITDPVAFDWDTHGRLWVAEMTGYPAGAGTPRQAMALKDGMARGALESPREPNSNRVDGDGRIRVLTDTDQDGRYDEAVTFLDGLNLPTGLHPWRDGWIITAAPDVIYAEDTDGDFRADIRTVLYTGFTEGNQQHRVNGLRWGLDGWLYLANGDSGGTINVLAAVADGIDVSERPSVNISGRDLRIQPTLGLIETLSGRSQFGRNRDDFGNWFGNNNSNPIWHYVLEDKFLSRNPHVVGARTIAQVAEIPGAAPVFPTSQTLARYNDFGSANRFTSACSTAIYRDTLLGEQFYGNAFTCEPVHNLVSRLVLERDGVTFKGRRADDEQNSEFFASSDNWTRPVMVRTGPDGAIYVADMYRQVIEHPEWIPAEYQRKLNLRAGEDRGRIYRITGTPRQAVASARGRSQTLSEPPTEPQRTEVKRSEATDRSRRAADPRAWIDDTATGLLPPDKLIARMSSPSGWWRDTAQRLLLRHPQADAVKALTELAQDHSSAAVRVQALHSVVQLHGGLTGLEQPLIHAVLHDSDAEVRRAALRYLQSPYPESVWDMVDDESPAVHQQLALMLLTSDQPEAASAMAQLMQQNSGSSDIITAAMTSLNSHNVGPVFQNLIANEDAPADLIGSMLVQAAGMQKLDIVRAPVLQMLQRISPESSDVTDDLTATRWRSVAATLTSLKQTAGGRQLLQEDVSISAALQSTQQLALATANDANHASDVRIAALQLVQITGGMPDASVRLLVEMLTPATNSELQREAVTAILGATPEKSNQLYELWDTLTPIVRERILQHEFQTPEGCRRLLDAIATRSLSSADVDATIRERLLSHTSVDVTNLAQRVFGKTTPSARTELVTRLKSEIQDLKFDPVNGQAVFTKSCSACHRLKNIGLQIGADLAALKDRSTDALLTAILDPNKAVETKFLSYTALTVDGKTFSGMLLNETGNSVTLLGTDGKQNLLARTDLEELICSNRSLMPEGIEKDLSPQQLADVMAFVQASGTKWKTFEGNAPRVVSRDSDGTITLPATAAQIYGPHLVFEAKHQNLGWWSSTDDYAVWSIDVPNGGMWTVEFDYACESSTAGNQLKLSTGNRLLSVRVPGSGTWDDYKIWTAGKIDLGKGRRQLTVTASETPTTALIDLKAIRLIPPD